MNIIAQDAATVKWTEKKRNNLYIANRMIDAGFEDRGKRMMFCGTRLIKSICPECGKSEVSSANLCRDRLCPTCSWRLSLRRYADMCATMQYLNDFSQYSAGFLTLTVKNCKPEDLRDTLKKMAQDWNRMMCDRDMKRITWGWARSLEITYNPITNTFHPHYHVIMITDTRDDTEGELNAYFRLAWASACRLSYDPITDYRWITNKAKSGTNIDNEDFTRAILETYKYSVKSDDMRKMPLDTFRQFVAAISGIRFCSFGGKIKEARRALGYKDNDGEVDEKIRLKCDCGASMTHALLLWSFEDHQYRAIATAFANDETMKPLVSQ